MNIACRFAVQFARLSLAIVLVVLPAISSGQQAGTTAPASQGASTTLWPHEAPQAIGTAEQDIPRLLAFVPARLRTTTAVLVIPGGGYSHLSLPTEGVEIAQFLNAAGITAFVLEYRLGPRYRYPVQLEDAERAMRYIRSNAAAYKVEKVGAIGFSAGGHLAAMLGTQFDAGDPHAADPIDRMSSRPDFLVLGYPVIADVGWAADGSLRNIDPDNNHPPASVRPDGPTSPPMSPKSLETLSMDLHVTSQTPPTFLVCADDDKSVSSENSARFYLALKHAAVPAELHIYAHGGHGFGLAAWDPVDGKWTAQMLDWLREEGNLPPLSEKR